MKGFTLLLIHLTSLGYLSFAKEGNSNEGEQTKEWLDPWDMTHYDAAAQTLDQGFINGVAKDATNKQPDYDRLQAMLSQCYKDLEKLPLKCQACAEKTVINASPCDTPYFKKVVRSILGNLEDRGDHEVVVTASEDDVATLEKFIKAGADGNVQDACEVIIGIVSNFKGKDDLYDFAQWDTSSLSYITREAILILAFLIFVISAAIIFETRTKLTWRTQLWGVLFLCFIISIPWEWYHLYRKAFASKQAQMEKDIPKHCRPDHELRPLESLMLWFRSSFTFSDDICVRYQETLLVDPIWEISPSKAISATVASIIAQPFEHIAEAIGKSFRALFREVPLQWQPFVFIAVIIIIIIAMFTLSGLQVRLPFMTITTVPALPGNVQGNLLRLENHVQNVEAVVQQLNNAAGQRDAIDHAPLQEDMNNRQGQILELLNAMNERQQRWEEVMRRAEPAVEGADPQPVQGALGPVDGGANPVGVEDERPERLPVMETPKLKVPVQSTDTEETTTFGVEDVGSSEHPSD